MDNTCEQNKHTIDILDILLNTKRIAGKAVMRSSNPLRVFKIDSDKFVLDRCAFCKWQSGQTPVDIHARHILVVSTYPGVFFSYSGVFFHILFGLLISPWSLHILAVGKGGGGVWLTIFYLPAFSSHSLFGCS